MIINLSRNSTSKEAAEALKKLVKKNTRQKTLKVYFGKLPGIFGDGLEFQKKARNEWE